MLQTYDNCPCHMLAYNDFLYHLLNETIWHKCWEEDVWLSGIAVQSNSSNSPLLIPHRKLGNYSLGTRNSYSLTSQHQDLYKLMLDTFNK